VVGGRDEQVLKNHAVRLGPDGGRLAPIAAQSLLFAAMPLRRLDPRDNWSDLSFYAKLGDRIERIAIVGAERWRSEAMMFAAADFAPRTV
jgi:hypothetical protein